MTLPEPSTSKKSLRWAWIIMPPVVLLVLFCVVFGPYLFRESLIRRLKAQHVDVYYSAPPSEVSTFIGMVQKVPGFRYFGMVPHRADVSYYRGVRSEMLPGILRDIRGLNVPLRVDLSGSTQLDRDIEVFAAERVEWLTVADRDLSPAAFQGLAKFKHLRELLLPGCQFDNDSLASLGKLTELEFASFDGTPLTDAGLQHLKGLKTLTGMTLSNTQVSEAAKADLFRALPDLGLTDD